MRTLIALALSATAATAAFGQQPLPVPLEPGGCPIGYQWQREFLLPAGPLHHAFNSQAAHRAMSLWLVGAARLVRAAMGKLTNGRADTVRSPIKASQNRQ